MKKHYIENLVIGAGIGGLSAAYELSKANKKCLILEKDEQRVGGDICSVVIPELDNVSIDFGAIQLWSHYLNWIEIADELDVSPQSLPFTQRFFLRNPDSDIYYKGNGVHTITGISSIQEGAAAYKIVSELSSVDPNMLLFYNPVHSELMDKNLFDYLAKLPEMQESVEIMSVGYTYGSIQEIPLVLSLPLMTRDGPEYTLYGKMGLITDKMKDYIISKQNQVELGKEVSEVNVQNKYVTLTNGDCYYYENVIVASPFGSIHFKDGLAKIEETIEDNIFNTWIMDQHADQFRYTHVSAVLIRVNFIPFISDTMNHWTACFESVPSAESVNANEVPFNILSYINLQECMKLKNVIVLYIRHNSANTRFLATNKTLLQDLINQVPLFVNNKVKITDMFYSKRFEHAMSVVTSKLHFDLQNVQGVNNIYFAGAYTQTIPNMESACYSGRSAAMRIIGGSKEEEFNYRIHKKDLEMVTKFQKKLRQRLLYTNAIPNHPFIVLLGFIILIIFSFIWKRK